MNIDEPDLWKNSRKILMQGAHTFPDLVQAIKEDRKFQREMKKKNGKKPPILVWRFEDAPMKYKILSNHGGDEDWVAFIPKESKGYGIPWAESGSRFGVCDVSEHEVENGIVLIGAHA